MARRRWSVQTRLQAQRNAERQYSLQQRLQEQAEARAALVAAQAQHADQKERARLYTESRIAQVSLLNEQLNRDVVRLGNLLSEALLFDSFINLQTLKQVPEQPVFNPGHLGVAEVLPVAHMPPALSGD
jgi:restriction system protein